MIEHSAHVPFILAAYALTSLVVAAMIVSIVVDYRVVRRALARFGTRGLDRE